MDPEESPEESRDFSDLGLTDGVLRAVREVGYERPSPIQAAAIPALTEGQDLVGVAQTGTGKTAAFILPALSAVDLEARKPQVLVLTPTRELALQVAEATKTYGRYLDGLRILPVYGGQGMDLQLRRLRSGVHVVVGTPGRVQDHLRRKTLDLSDLKVAVLDEADEMLRMGFLEEVTDILENAPEARQTALFSATMPKAIRSVARRYLKEPTEVRIEAKTTTVASVRQRYWQVRGLTKLDALTRVLEAEPFDAVLIFARTKNATAELAEKLEARGFDADALNGDLNQAARERVVDRLKAGRLDVVVATDVAARGLDVPRITHVINYDIPYDTESYVHRIGRTGRAGREGEAILFVTHRERRMLASIERATRSKIAPMRLPTQADVTARRVERFAQEVGEALVQEDLDLFIDLAEALATDHDVGPERLAGALAYLAQRERPLGLGAAAEADEPPPAPKLSWKPEGPLRPFRVGVGRQHGIFPGNLVGALVNEAGLAPKNIGRIDLMDDHSFVELPADLPDALLQHLAGVLVCGVPLELARAKDRPVGRPQRGGFRGKGGRGPGRGGPRGRGAFRGKPSRGKPFRGKPFRGKGFQGKPFRGKPQGPSEG